MGCFVRGDKNFKGCFVRVANRFGMFCPGCQKMAWMFCPEMFCPTFGVTTRHRCIQNQAAYL